MLDDTKNRYVTVTNDSIQERADGKRGVQHKMREKLDMIPGWHVATRVIGKELRSPKIEFWQAVWIARM